MADRRLLAGATIAGFAVLNVAGIAAIANGNSIGSFDDTAASGATPQIQEGDDRWRELSGAAAQSDAPRTGSDSQTDESSTVERTPERQESVGGEEMVPPLPGGGPGRGLIGAGPGGPGDREDNAEEAWTLRNLLSASSLEAGEIEDIATNETPGSIIETKLEEEDDEPVYKVKVHADDGNLYEYEVDADSGEVLESEIKDSSESREVESLLRLAATDRDEAVNLATAERPGEVVENKLTERDGYAVYEIEILSEEGTLYETFINAENGEILASVVEGNASDYQP